MGDTVQMQYTFGTMKQAAQRTRAKRESSGKSRAISGAHVRGYEDTVDVT